MYRAKATFTGYKLGLNTPHLYIGVPDKYWTWDDIAVEFQGKEKTFYKMDIKTSRTFNDKFRPGETYTLLYVLWEEREYEPAKKKEEKTGQQESLF